MLLELSIMVNRGHVFTKWLVANTELKIKYKETSHIITELFIKSLL